MHSASIEFHSGASLCRISRCNLFLHWSCSWPPFLLHSRNRPARLQRIEMCQSRHLALGLGNASKAALLGQPRITASNLFIPVTFVGYPTGSRGNPLFSAFFSQNGEFKSKGFRYPCVL